MHFILLSLGMWHCQSEKSQEVPPSKSQATGLMLANTFIGSQSVEGVLSEDGIEVDDLYFPTSLLKPSDAKTSKEFDVNYLWPGGKIPYEFYDFTDSALQAKVEKAMRAWEQDTGFQFYPATNSDVNLLEISIANKSTATLGWGVAKVTFASPLFG
jgi:hypothetical protein